jgi:hypothetical protein
MECWGMVIFQAQLSRLPRFRAAHLLYCYGVQDFGAWGSAQNGSTQNKGQCSCSNAAKFTCCSKRQAWPLLAKVTSWARGK